MKINFFQSLRFRMPLLIILGIMPPAILAVIGAGQYVKTLIDDLTKTTVALEAESLEISSSSWIEMNVLALKNLSQQPAIQSLQPQAQEEILAKFTDTYQDTYLAHTTGLDGINLARSDKKAPKDYGDRKYFQNAIAGKDISYQTLVGRTSQKPALCIATPIKQDNTILGVTTICSLLDKLAESVGAIRIGKTGYGFIIDNLGQVLAHPNSELFSGKTLTDFSDYPPVKNLLAGNEGYFIFSDQHGIEWVAQGNLLDNGWGVIILQHKAEAFAKQVYLQNITVIILLLALVAVGSLSWLLADTLIKPIRKLSQAASDFAAGKLDRIINIQRRDELGFLSESFNKMAQQLQDSFFAIEEHNLKLDKLLEEQQEAERHQRNAKEKLQLEVRKFKDQLAPVSKGNLTVRINVTDEEIGAVADYYNITIQNLQQIVAEVTSVTQIVTQTTNNSKSAISELSQGALQQTEEITKVLSQVERMTESIQLVAANAQEAEISIRQATETVKKGHSSLNTTVEKIVNLGESTTAAKEQVQKLGKASKRISKAVQLIHTIALQTNVLAVNASIEAARAGQEGMGFNVVAEEVQSLAVHSVKTANEIEQLVLEIQTETGKVLKVMEKSNKEILEGSQSMQEIRASLQQVTNASLEIDQLIEIVSKMATEQSCTSKEVTATMADVAAISNSTSVSANDVSSSFRELLQVAEKLQDSVGQFKIN